jgi:heme transporter
VMIPDDISAAIAPSADLRMVLKSAARLRHLAPDAICVADPLAFTGCERNGKEPGHALPPGQAPGSDDAAALNAASADNRADAKSDTEAGTNGHSGTKKLVGGLAQNSIARAIPWGDRPVHPVTLWRGRLSVAIDALEEQFGATGDADARQQYERRSPVETTNVQLPTGDRLLIPTGAEALRLKSYLIMRRNTRRDYAEFADMVDTIDPETAAVVLAGMDRYYCCHPPKRLPKQDWMPEQHWMASQLVRRLADPHPCDLTDAASEPDAPGDRGADWEEVRQRCLSVAVAMLEEAR